MRPACCKVHLCHRHFPPLAAILQVEAMHQVGSCQSAGVSCKGPLCMACVSSSRPAASRVCGLLPNASSQIVCQMALPATPGRGGAANQHSCFLVQGATMEERARLQQHLHDLQAGPLQLQDLGNQHLVPLQLWGLCLRAVDGSGLDEGTSEGYLEHLWDLLLLQV